ncbi:MAG: hypothetical protein M1833_002739 [Piccolia ochrophora]|nr:MAG: hypothetical protein M1833_002739 [Piccolia ochrophora]
MSEPIPESIPTSADKRSHRPTKKRALTPLSAQASQVDALFAHPEREIAIPLTATKEGAGPRSLVAPPEIVANVQGSSAGAGSGEFHVYKASRRREYERVRLMEEEVRLEKENAELERKKEEWKKKDEVKTGKNRARREKMKARKTKTKGSEGEEAAGGDAQKKDGVGVGTAKISTASNGIANGGGTNGTEQEGQPYVEQAGVIIHDDDD